LAQNSEDPKKDQMRRLRLRIVEASCATCIVPVRKALEREPGVKRVGANVVLDLILVDYDTTLIDVRKIIETIKRTGYNAVPTTTL
jgi:P-type Cu+ transporter